MDINKNIKTMKKLSIYFFSLIAILSLGLTSCDDDNLEQPRLFRPQFSSMTSDANTLAIVWKMSADAESYTIEISRDQTFEKEAEFSATVSETKYTFIDLLYNTEYYIRIKANNADPGKDSNWTYYEGAVKTRARVIPTILRAIESTDIGETSVTLRWDISEEYPVDSISVVENVEGAIPFEFKLTAAQIQAGYLYVDGLNTNAFYKATVFNTKANEDARNYNTRNFRTVGPPSEAIILEANDNFAKILEDELNNPERAELVFYLPAGANYYMFADNSFNLDENGKILSLKGVFARNYNITKSVTIMGAPGITRPTLWLRTGKWQITTDIANFTVDGVNVKEFISEEFNQQPSNGTYWFNLSARTAADGPITIGEFAIKNSEIKGLHRGIFMCNSDNADGASITINKITVDNCVYTSGAPHERFGVFTVHKKNINVWADISITNSTFYDCPATTGLFSITTANAMVPQRGNIVIENCTFFDFGSTTGNGGITISSLPAPGVDLKMNKCLVGVGETTNTYPFCVIGANNTLSAVDNFHVLGWTVKTNDIPFTNSNVTAEDLFESHATGNFEIKDKDSDIYKFNIGDPRWIK
jgi:hypothetical protein